MLAAPHISMPVFSGYRLLTVNTRYHWHKHQHHEHEILIIDSGTYHCTLNDTALDLPANRILIVKPGDWHEDAASPSLKYHAIGFTLRNPAAPGKPLSLLAEGLSPQEQTFAVDRRQLAPLLQRMTREMQQSDDIGPMMQDALLRQFFWQIIRWLPRQRISPLFLRNSAEQAFVARFTAILSANRHRLLTVPEMARAMQMSVRSLCDRCARFFHESPARVALSFRLRHGADLLTGTSMPIKEISHTLGFANPYHFSRAFRRRYGRAPLLYRQG